MVSLKAIHRLLNSMNADNHRTNARRFSCKPMSVLTVLKMAEGFALMVEVDD